MDPLELGQDRRMSNSIIEDNLIQLIPYILGWNARIFESGQVRRMSNSIIEDNLIHLIPYILG